jgi:hypothetical protein
VWFVRISEKSWILFLHFLVRIYYSLLIHVSIASSTAFDRSPFFPPNLSIVLNLSDFSSSSEIATLTLPISITNHTNFHILNCLQAPQARCFSNKQIVLFRPLVLFLLSFIIHLSLLILLYYYGFTHL